MIVLSVIMVTERVIAKVILETLEQRLVISITFLNPIKKFPLI